ncbi:hypothetical protein JCM1841_002795 [Sporobolomyces salmonicolor]
MALPVWYAIPQVLMLHKAKPIRGGPTFLLLGAWLAGDIGQTVGIFLNNGLTTQKFSGICFAITDIIIIVQLCWYRGLVYRTARSKERMERKEAVIALIRGVHAEPRRPAPPPLSTFPHETDLELGEGECKRVHKKKNGRRSPNDTGRDTDISTGFFRSGWKDVPGPKFNIAGLLLVSPVAFAVWFWQDLSRFTSKPALVVSSPPTDMVSWLGWSLGMAGTAAYSALPFPSLRSDANYRVYLYATWRSKSMESIAVWSFASLILQNVTMTVSILAVSHILSSVFAQSPYILNVGLALVGRHPLSALPRAPGPSSSLSPSPPNDPGASSVSEFYQDEHRRDLHSGLVPPLPAVAGARQPRPLPEPQVQRKRAAATRRNHLERDALHRMRLSALASESRADPSERNVLPLMYRRQTRHEFDARKRAEQALEARLAERVASSDDAAETRRHAEWEQQTGEVRENLKTPRERNREADASEASEHDRSRSWSGNAPRRNRDLARSMDRHAVSSSRKESDDGEEPRRLTGGRPRDVRRSAFHPRRGVGTLE